MRLDPKLVHPSIFKATDRVMWSGQMMGDEKATDMKSVSAHQQVWFKEYGKGCLLYAFVSAAALLGTFSLAHDMSKPWKIILIMAVMAAIVGVGMGAYMRNLRQITGPELAALLPMLDLTETQRAYAETVVALERSGRSKLEIDETMSALNSLLDEETKLIETRDRLSGTDHRTSRDSLVAEREKLVDRIASARDAEAKKAFEQSLGLLDERLDGFEGQNGHSERLEAHLELLRQAVLATRDAALHRSALPAAPDLATDSLRSAVALARAQTQATEQALAELRAI